MNVDYSEIDENGREWRAAYWIDTGESSGGYHHATMLEIHAFMKHYNVMFGHHSHRILFRQCAGPPPELGPDEVTFHPVDSGCYIWD